LLVGLRNTYAKYAGTGNSNIANCYEGACSKLALKVRIGWKFLKQLVVQFQSNYACRIFWISRISLEKKECVQGNKHTRQPRNRQFLNDRDYRYCIRIGISNDLFGTCR